MTPQQAIEWADKIDARRNIMSMAQRSAVLAVARAHGWDQMSVKDVGLLMWAAFHYYVMRL